MKSLFRGCLFVGLLLAFNAERLSAAIPRTLEVRVGGQTADLVEPLATDTWHTIIARYHYAGDVGLLTNTYMILCADADRLRGLDVGYHVPTNRLAIVKLWPVSFSFRSCGNGFLVWHLA